MKKTSLGSFWNRLVDASKWVFLAGFVFFALISVFALRQNNLRAIELRDAVLEADKNKGDVELALQDLREHVHAHMNADLSAGTGLQQPVQLKYRYDRLVAAEEKRVEKANEAIYPEAQAYCERQLPSGFSGGTRIACIEEYVLENGEEPKEIPDNLYKFDFVAPRWSPDLAGLSLLLSGVFLIVFVFKFAMDKWLKSELSE